MTSEGQPPEHTAPRERAVKRSGQFKRDYKREAKGRHGGGLDTALMDVVNLLVVNKPLPPNLRDHALTNNWKDHRDCHLKPNLVLVYRLPDDDTLELVRLGSHSELGL